MHTCRWPLLLFSAVAPAAAAGSPPKDAFTAARETMVARQIESRGIKDPAVLAAMRRVPRHEFVPAAQRPFAYDDRPLPIAAGQTISQPLIVALMTELLHVKPGQRVLEIGTGSGYQAAVLAELKLEVYSIEIVAELATSARATLARLGYEKVNVRAGDGYLGWPEAAPFDAIIVTAAPPKVPQPLIDQLKPGARLVVPEGDREQELIVYEKTAAGELRRTSVIPVRFVPMTGRAQEKK
jgi:protein-L-isoaspartate(D-aspartate) O-methyltransferase